MTDPLFVGSTQRFEIIKVYQRLKLRPSQGEDTMVRRIVKDMGKYTIDSNRTNTFVARVIKDYDKKVGEEQEKRSMLWKS